MKQYEAPKLKVVGLVAELTEQDKKFGDSEGFTFLTIPITNNS